MKSICYTCEHYKTNGHKAIRQPDGSTKRISYGWCSFLNISLSNLQPTSERKCSHFTISEKASPEEKFNALSI